MRQATIFCLLSALLLMISLVFLVVLQFPNLWERVPFQWWVHVAIIVVGLVGFWQLRRLRIIAPYMHFGFFQGLPIWLILLGLLVIFIVAPLWLPSSFDLGQTPDGEPVYRKNLFESEGKYYLNLNKNPPIEISRVEYLGEERKMYEKFVRMWVLFSYLSLGLWQYIWRKRRAFETADQPLDLDIIKASPK